MAVFPVLLFLSMFALATVSVWAEAAALDCTLAASVKAESVQAEKVLDGDTLVLVDGRHVRLIGVNTPEVAHPPRPEEPLAVDAQRQLEQLVRKNPLYLEVGQQPRDLRSSRDAARTDA